MGRTYIVVRTSFEALHQWPTCPFEDVAFLKLLHRHIFHVEMKFEVTSDRQIEFIRQKRRVEEVIKNSYAGKDLGPTSCEVIAKALVDSFGAVSASVFEDNENGAEFHA